MPSPHVDPPYPLVFFDVDSTLVTIEGIDELAAGDPEIARMTDAAMNGTIPIDEVYGRRLERIRPTRQRIAELGALYQRSLVPGARDTVAELTRRGVAVHLVTAGIEQAVAPLAAALGIPARRLHAVALEFDAAGNYAGFDPRTPLTRKGGKQVVVMNVRSRNKGRAAFVGDGVSDLETKEAVNLFIGFGGVKERAAVAAGAHHYVRETSLAAVLPLLLERNADAR